jgi:hypothetical protein
VRERLLPWIFLQVRLPFGSQRSGGPFWSKLEMTALLGHSDDDKLTLHSSSYFRIAAADQHVDFAAHAKFLQQTTSFQQRALTLCIFRLW